MRKNGDIDVSDTTQSSNPEASIRLATFDQYRSLLFSIAYRMLGSVADAEDMLQETLSAGSRQPMTISILRAPFSSPSLAGYALITCSLRAYNAKNMWDSGCRNRS
jgi:hypothetical protein